MKNWYDILQKSATVTSRSKRASDLGPDGDLSRVSHESTGMDSFLGDLPDTEGLSALFTDRRASQVKPGERVKVASVDHLSGFTRIASDTLIRHAERDLWSIKEGEDGDFFIERLFDDDGNPLKV